MHEHLAEDLALILPGWTNNYIGFFESIGYQSSSWLLFYFPIIILAGGYFYKLFKYFRSQSWPLFYTTLFMGGCLLFLSVPVIEFINSRSGFFSENVLHILIAVEEYVEMLGVTLFLSFTSLILRDAVRQLKEKIL
jgi:hypothetical protein